MAVQNIRIPFHKSFLDHRALDAVRAALDSGNISGDGPVSKTVEAKLRALFGVGHAMLTTSCTHALEMAMMMLDLRPGDEVILPSFTFVSTANAVLRAGGKPVFCDINDRTLTIDAETIDRLLTPRTRAVIPVHYAGVSAEMDAIMTLGREHRLTIVEDAAQGVNATYKGKFLGTIGDAGAYSFHGTKNYVCGEGGAFLTNEERFARRAEIIREKGTNRSNFLRGEVDKYTWVDEGSSYILSDLLAAILQSQLEQLGVIQEGRRRVHERYMTGLLDLERSERLRLPIIPEHCSSNYHIFYILLKSERERVEVMGRLKEAGIGSTFHYVPLHSSPFARGRLGTDRLELPVTDRVFERLLRLPIYPQLNDAEVDDVIASLHRILR